ncbi:MAG: YchJ family protein [Desulfatitalea sp.]|nr:YchJ family protein [Desulfatitalea sp.]NNK00324.1 YchJ family protein [Desulfatitalea sp.]
MMHIAYFITDHGFGHASRSAAIMAALARQVGDIRFELFTTSPQWIFSDSLGGDFGYHEIRNDVGMVQRSPIEVDLDATVQALNRLMPFDPGTVSSLVEQVQKSGCRLIVCDISALGIVVAQGAGLPSVLIENFTWDFIYASCLEQASGLEMFADYLKHIYAQADLHIQCEPICRPAAGASVVSPVSRSPRTPAARIRRALNIADNRKMVLVSMGGIPDQFHFLTHTSKDLPAHLVVPSANGLRSNHPHITLLPTHSRFYHPDLLAAADLLIGKAGYSTIAEAYQAGVPFGYIPRCESAESPALERFITTHLPSRSISADVYNQGQWLAMLPELLTLEKVPQPNENGADTVARILMEMYHEADQRSRTMETCPCGSGQAYCNCCEPLIQGQRPALTAEALMRSRYTAHVKSAVDYIVETTHPDQREDLKRESIQSWAKNALWLGLEIIDAQAGGPEDETGVVEFTARYRQKGKKVEHREIAEFKKHEERWYFVDGRMPKVEQALRKGPKVGRNDPCPCGSGKKFKKCCQ